MNIYEPIINKEINIYTANNLFKLMNLSDNIYPEDKNFDFSYSHEENYSDGDFTIVSSNIVIALKNKLCDIIKPLNIGEILQIDDNYSIIQPKILNALSFWKSKINRSIVNREIISINKYSFKEKILKEEYMFRIKGLPCSPIYVTQKFVDLYESYNFTGLKFIPVKQ